MCDSSSELSEHSDREVQKLAPIFLKAKKATKLVAPPPLISPPRPKRPPSPPREPQFADDPDIALIVMFRSRFNEAFSAKLSQFGPQDVERGVGDGPPSPQIEHLLCALLGLVNNRKKPVERGHHARALEEAVLTHKSNWPHRWDGRNPLHGGNTFENMGSGQRLNLLRTLIMWSLSSSELIQGMIKDKYKQVRHSDDENQPLSVQPWGQDCDKRRYFLIQGLDDTGFRIYREGSRYTKNAKWISVAGSIDEAKALARKLEKDDGSQAGRRLAGKIQNAIPTFEATEEKRRRREYRQVRRAAFTRPEPGFSLYEGRTRGKRMRYTFDDDEASVSDATSTRRSTRHSTRTTPFEAGPTFTASGRQVRQRKSGGYGESLLSNGRTGGDDRGGTPADGTEKLEKPWRDGRATRSSAASGATNQRKRKYIDGYNEIDEMSDEDDAPPSGDEWDSDQNERENEMPDVDEYDDDTSSSNTPGHDEVPSLIVKLKIPSKAASPDPIGDSIALKPLHAATPPVEAAVDRPVAPPPHTSTALAPRSPPAGPSGYPTPTSSSYVSSKHHKQVSSSRVPAAPASAAAQAAARQKDEAASAPSVLSPRAVMGGV